MKHTHKEKRPALRDVFLWGIFTKVADKMDQSIQKQIEICNKYGVAYQQTSPYLKLGISLNVFEGALPINGLRQLPIGDSSGWYIWDGEEFSYADDFFVPLHIEHLFKRCPDVLKYLGLPAGCRFLINNKGYEDVWCDEDLIKPS